MASDEQQSGGFIHLLPAVVPGGMTLEAMTFSLLPWQAPSYGGLVGHKTDSPGTPLLSVTFEWPIPWLRVTEPIKQFDQEWLYLRRFSSDQALATGEHAYSEVQPGADPPDATVSTAAGRLGAESTALTVGDRRTVHALFRQLRIQLLRQEPALFQKLTGHLIYIWFSDEDQKQLAKPPRRTELEVIGDLIQRLSEYEPEPEAMWVPGGEIPDQAPELPLAEGEGAKFYAVPFVNSAPSTMLFSIAGFELGLAYTTQLTYDDALAEVQRLISVHDKPGVDLLLITASGPDQNGLIYPAEEAIANFLKRHFDRLPKAPEHIKMIFLHNWMTGDAFELFPDPGPRFGPIFQSVVPEHFPIHVGSTGTGDADQEESKVRE
jgi:hypothetical protein